MDFNLQLFSREDLDNLISKRTGEIKLGSTLTTKINDAKFVILGVEESIGPKANFGKSGSENGFDAFLSAFLNMQSNESLSGEKITVLGKIISTSDFEGDNLREGVEKLDEFILSILN